MRTISTFARSCSAPTCAARARCCGRSRRRCPAAWAWQIARPSASAASGPGTLGKSEQAHHHLLHLFLLRLAVADDRALHLQCRVLGDRELVGDERRERGAARLAEQQRRLRVDVDEHDLDRRARRRVARGDLAHAVEDDLEPPGKVGHRHRGGADRSARHVAEPAAGAIDDAEARRAKSGIDAEHAHGRHWNRTRCRCSVAARIRCRNSRARSGRTPVPRSRAGRPGRAGRPRR